VDDNGSHETLTQEAAKLKPGESDLLALDWNNGKSHHSGRSATHRVPARPKTTVHDTPRNYRALDRSPAFGALNDHHRFEEYGVKVEQIVNWAASLRRIPWSCKSTRM